MSTKIQILNEKQVDHFADVLLPQLIAKFDTARDILREQAEKEKDNFVTHAEVIKLKAEQTERLEMAKKTVALTTQLEEVDDKLYLSRNGCYGSIITTQEGLEKLEKDQVKKLNDLLLELSMKNLFVDQSWTRRGIMSDELRARLSMTPVNDFDKIVEVILESIDINSFFKTTLTSN